MCKDIVEKTQVKLRGWYYPHFPTRIDANSNIVPCENCYEAWIDWGAHKEYWRMYQSSQFIHYLALREDWLEGDSWFQELNQKVKANETLFVLSSIVFQITEIYEFLIRLATQGLYENGVNVYLTLKNTKDRKLWLDDRSRVGFSFDRITGAKEIILPEKFLTKNDLMKGSRELALPSILYVLERFDWSQPPIDTITADQERLLNRRL